VDILAEEHPSCGGALPDRREEAGRVPGHLDAAKPSLSHRHGLFLAHDHVVNFDSRQEGRAPSLDLAMSGVFKQTLGDAFCGTFQKGNPLERLVQSEDDIRVFQGKSQGGPPIGTAVIRETTPTFPHIRFSQLRPP
jgi:hypothetical protein